ncbi:T9SS type A sorting domain-containing protein [Epilithonimonas sp. JDS]|uniref:T9SS type A sorting domain-containing protein n=1 Tax=Epilithonimonas sp. JDS TaxID=2902797 RepID=UPI001E60A402|nr:T9SS type A sorting domain-containing protein [Epilithonimonas sp. JDS]MCD9855990.1 T9SS type A sorting domain-containing protein [Epilithonimonas sp. JDS]
MKNFFLVICLVSSLILPAQAGTLDTTFDPGNGPDMSIVSLALQPDNKILIGGFFTDYNGITRRGVARLNENGSLDSSFNPLTGAVNEEFFARIYSIVLQTDRKILIGGEFTSYDGIPRRGIARLNENGTLDATFNPETGAQNYHVIFTIAVQSDNKILIGGYFTSFNGVVKNNLVRLNADGSIDNSFNIGTGVDSAVTALAVQSDGKILIGGDFTSYNGMSSTRIARLNSDGSLDTTFETGSGTNDSISKIIIQPDGKILISGQLTSYDGNPRNRIARLNQDGTIDNTFTNGNSITPNNHIESIVLQTNGKILVGGYITKYNGIITSSILRLNADGSLDTSFNSGTGVSNATVNSIVLQSDSKILIGGNFDSYNGVTRNRIARLLLGDDLSVENANGTKISIYPNPATDIININTRDSEIKNITIYDMIGNQVMSSRALTKINVKGLLKGNYILKVETDKGIKSFKFIKD